VGIVEGKIVIEPSNRCAEFIKGFETCKLNAYMPTPQDRPTIGWGTTGPDVHRGLTWTQAQLTSVSRKIWHGSAQA
jgi:GH24 family phage-related lysozyme (muramidase)